MWSISIYFRCIFVWSTYSKGLIIIALFSGWHYTCLSTFFSWEIIRLDPVSSYLNYFVDLWSETKTGKIEGPCLARSTFLSDNLTRSIFRIVAFRLFIRLTIMGGWGWKSCTQFNTYLILDCTITLVFILIWNLCNFWF